MKIQLFKWLMSCCLLLFIAATLPAQTIERQLISPYGSLSETSQVHLSATAGESMVRTVFTSNYIISEGFQQPNIEDIVGAYDLSPLEIEITVAPNPVKDLVEIRLFSPEQIEVYYELFAMNGKIISSNNKLEFNGNSTIQLKMTHLSYGTYLLLIRDAKGQLIKHFKLQKI